MNVIILLIEMALDKKLLIGGLFSRSSLEIMRSLRTLACTFKVWLCAHVCPVTRLCMDIVGPDLFSFYLPFKGFLRSNRS